MSAPAMTVRQLRDALSAVRNLDAAVWLTWADDEAPATCLTIQDGRVLRLCADNQEIGSAEAVLFDAAEEVQP